MREPRTCRRSIRLQMARRDDRRVAQALFKRQEVDAIHPLTSAGALDSVFVYMNDIGFIGRLQSFNILGYKRMMLPLTCFVLPYIAKILSGIPSMNALPELLFANTALMEMLGFNGLILTEGLCKRGQHRRSPGKKPPRPFSAQTIANVLQRFTFEESEALLNLLISQMAQKALLDSELAVIVDATDLVVSDGFKDLDACGTTIRIKKVVGKSGQIVEIEVVERGFKLITLFCQKLRIPLAAKIVRINEHESQYTMALINQAKENLGDRSRIVKIYLDRGFIDGPTLHEIDEMGIVFVIPSKNTMSVTADARSLAAYGGGHVASRCRTVYKGRGRFRRASKLETELVGIEGLCTYDQYAPASEAIRRTRRDHCPKPINAVAVREWDNKYYGPGGKCVFLTNGPVNDPFVVFDDYDERSLIENTLHREGKQSFSLGALPKRRANALYAHCYMVLCTYAIIHGYRRYMAGGHDFNASLWPLESSGEPARAASYPPKSDSLRTPPQPFQGIGMARWRRQLAAHNATKMIVFLGQSYGIYDVDELAALTGVRLKMTREQRDRIRGILEQYDIDFSP
ncbi:MAG: transposase [Clostridia bacterium]|nr:transposase [Clostridia bacterium]